MRWTLRIGSLCLVLLLGYTAWPFVDLYRLGRAIERHNADAVMSRLELRGIRPSISRQVLATYLRLSGREAKLGGLTNYVAGAGAAFIDPTLDELLSKGRLVDFFREGLDAAAASSGGSKQRFSLRFNSLGSLWDLYANSEYSLGDFYVSVPPRVPTTQRYRLRLHLIQWQWKLYGIELPDVVRTKLAQQMMEQVDKHR